MIDPGLCKKKELTSDVITTKWLSEINERLYMDQCLTSRVFGKRAIPQALVLRAWDEVLDDRPALPD
ncbi:hypothetical protein C2E23DRAFT_830818, partial [Lenzites betulinus]